jgi:hypothetical protein
MLSLGERRRHDYPLWPWPMNERLKAATAAAGAYGAGYPASVVGAGRGRATVSEGERRALRPTSPPT